ncbi:hypothetical protein [Fodinibius salsisoli]|uniref:Helix-turn-helix type 11 domain-containing protein n=1 Tax=Fodinibius salsisoli TaxID=2820877 RepID=A0ABT3PRZ2_9BACT|nr:hypothetical protein [Fodinibius salsisoli]MCW9708621.1 hypothetical protein [Fodinibius salsisoli]
MSLRTYLNRIHRLDALIRRKSTGPPEELADKLDISERWLYKFLGELKEEFEIVFHKYLRLQSILPALYLYLKFSIGIL